MISSRKRNSTRDYLLVIPRREEAEGLSVAQKFTQETLAIHELLTSKMPSFSLCDL
jgi:hypothetical protein